VIDQQDALSPRPGSPRAKQPRRACADNDDIVIHKAGLDGLAARRKMRIKPGRQNSR